MTQLDQKFVDSLQGYIAEAERSLAAKDTVNAMNYINLYYQAQTDFRGYASDALQVINNIGQFGNVANQDVILVVRFRHLHPFAAGTRANAGIKGPLATI